MKTCNICLQSKPLSEFTKNSRRPDGLQYRCRLCWSLRLGRKPRTQIPTVKLSPELAAYIAGLIDGEGCICIYKVDRRGKLQYNLNIAVKMGGDFLGALASEVGLGTYYHNITRNRKPDHWKHIHEWRWPQADARCLLPQIRPYLRHKAAQADLALTFLALPWKHTTEQKGELYTQSRQLNRRGLDVAKHT